MKFRNSFHPYAIVTILCWSLAYVLTRLSLQYFSTFALGFLRYFVASITMIIFAVIMKMKPPKRKDLPEFLLSGILGFAFYMIAYNNGQKAVSAATGSVVIATVPVITALLARFIYKEKLKSFQWAAIVIGFSGVAVLTLMDGAFSINTGLFWLIAAAVSVSLYNLLQRKLTKTYSALQTSAFSIFFGTLLLAVFLPVSVQEVSQVPAIALIYIVVLGVFSSAIAYASWAKAFSKAATTSQVSNYMFFTPFLTSVLGFVLAHEIPDIATITGGSIILFGVLIFNFGDKFLSNFRRIQEHE